MLITASRVALTKAATRRAAVVLKTRPLLNFRCFSAAPDEDDHKTKVASTTKTVGKPAVLATPEPLGKPVAASEKDLPVSYADISRAHVVSRLHY